MSANNERISINTFVERYNKLTNEQLKDKYIKEHIKTHYSPIFNKKIVLEAMNDKSVVEDSMGKYIDLTVSKINLVMAILVLYTDIEPEKDESGIPKAWETYDILKSTKLFDKILNNIGSDIEELMTVQSQVLDTWYSRNTSTDAYIANLIDLASHKFGVYAGVGMEKLAEVLEDEAKMKKVIGALDKVMKKVNK